MTKEANLTVCAFGEVIGTFIFLSVIAVLTRNKASYTPCVPFAIAFGLLVSIYIFGELTGGHFNPAVSFMKFIVDPDNKKSPKKFFVYLVAQLIGATLAVISVYFLYKEYDSIKQVPLHRQQHIVIKGK